MILYDQNYNFIGMSSENLSYLGYEDLSDFTSQHSDFANLLVNKEGFIYKFQNFSWIDFILYSGSPNKAALLKQKNGAEVEIKLSVKEVFLTTEINNNQKYYAVRIISDNFVNIASQTDPEISKKSPPKNSFNLNNLITEEGLEPSTNIVKEEFASIPSPSMQEPVSEKSEEFVLNFPSQESIEESNNFKLDLTQESETPPLSAEEKNDEAPIFQEEFKLKLSTEAFDEPILASEEESVESFLKMEESTLLKEEPAVTFDIQRQETFDASPVQEENTASGFSLKHASTPAPEVQESVNSPINLNFLQTQEPEPVAEINIEPETPLAIKETTQDANLSFLKQATRHEVQELEPMHNKEEIISQIQHDIAEIDADDDTPLTIQQETLTQNEGISDISTSMFNQNEAQDEKKSFTKTLKSLFNQPEEISNESADFMDEPSALLKKNDEITAIGTQEIPKVEETLSTLGLDKEEENDLIIEFIEDTQQNIELFKQYHQSNQETQANYTLIKIQSSAEILNLNDIINTIHSIKQATQDAQPSQLKERIECLEEDVARLALHVESETV